MTTAALRLLLPEIVLTAAAVAIYLGGAFRAAERAWSWIAAAALLAAASALCTQPGSAVAGGPLNVDQLAWLGRWLALALGALLVLLASRPLESSRHTPCAGAGPADGVGGLHSGGTSEYVGSLLLTVAGLMLVAAAADLVLLFVALELISIPTYILLYLGRSDAAHQESAAKYFFLSVLSSAILLYGFSFLCGIAGFAPSSAAPHGMTGLAAVRAAMDGGLPSPGTDGTLVGRGAGGEGAAMATFAKLAMVLVFAGLSFKVAAVPFHFYAPDVYQGTTHPNAALLSVVPKAAGLLAMVRILAGAMPGMAPYSWQMVLLVSLLTMTVANLMALWQDDLRRLLAYSSIAHAGYMLLALAVALAGGASDEWNGLAALWFYLVAYALATIGAFAVLEHLGSPRRVDSVDELAGLGRTRPAAAAVLAVCLLSLTGVPPLAGFWGKFWVFGSALNVGTPADGAASLRWWFIAAAVIGVLNAAVAAAYYLRVVAVMYFRTPLATPRAQGGLGPWSAAVLCALLVVAIGVYPGPLIKKAAEAGDSCSVRETHHDSPETAGNAAFHAPYESSPLNPEP